MPDNALILHYHALFFFFNCSAVLGGGGLKKKKKNFSKLLSESVIYMEMNGN